MWRLLFREYRFDTVTREVGLLERVTEESPTSNEDFSDWFQTELARCMALDDDIKCRVVLKRAVHELKDHRVMETKPTADKFPAMRSSLLGTCQRQTAVYLASPVSQLLWKLVLWVRSRSHRILGPQYPWSVVGLFITIRGVGTLEKDKANFGSHPGGRLRPG